MARLMRRDRLAWIADAALRPYAQIVFSRDAGTGLLVLLAIAPFPRVALATLGAVGVAALVSLAFGLGSEEVREGASGCMAVLAVLGVAVFGPGDITAALVVSSAVLGVLFAAAFRGLLGRLALPALSLPFVAAAWTMILTTRVMPAPAAPSGVLQPLRAVSARVLEPGWLDVPASIVYLHGSLSGALMVAAIAWHSRIGLLLAAVGGLVAAAICPALRLGAPWSAIEVTAGFNAVLTAMAIGGVWFVPHPTSILLAAGGAAVACLVTFATFPVAGLAALPALSLPFAIATLAVLAASRVRERDRWPRAAVQADRPEETLSRHLMRIRRFGDSAWLPFRLPCRGVWLITQGHQGAHTHQAQWRHALDFERAGADGRLFERDGQELRDYHCYGLPVLAAAPGTVDQVIDGLPDNAPGRLDARNNWGNAVVVAHAGGLYSVYAHLVPRSIRVKPGDGVAAGSELARCGNSGRSSVPHLHFQVQRGAPLGSETVAADFGDVIAHVGSEARLSARMIPAEGDSVRAVVRDEAIAGAMSLVPGSEWTLRRLDDGRHERARVELDLLGRHTLKSAIASLYFEPYESGIVLMGLEGRTESLLRLMMLALARMPFDQEAPLSWRDALPRSLFVPRWARAMFDLVAVVVPQVANVEIDYTSRRTEGRIEVEGRADRLSTRAVVDMDGGPHHFEVLLGGRRTAIELCREESTGGLIP